MTRKKNNSKDSKKHNHKNTTKVSPGTILVLVLLGGIFIYGGVVAFGSGEKNMPLPENVEGFAACLLESDAIFYGTEWCSFCGQQKQVLGDVFRQFNSQFYVDCDRNRDRCATAGIRAYPTWIINGQMYQGVQSIDALSNAMNCQL